MTAQHIQRRLMMEHYQRSFVLPNYTPSGWWECDIFLVTKAGFFWEYEIKLTVSDFRRDVWKVKRDWRNMEGVNKHELLARHDARGPAHFWFVMPSDLVPMDEIPSWAGVIWVSKYREERHPVRGLNLNIGRRSPRLHVNRLHPDILKSAQATCYWRFHRALSYPEYREPEYSI